ncbi:MAG: hypothetical protein SFY66_00745 [Oculatellaceae cyanobacterium bins.114]|nr:hypothetical protein [Oculatellaceae cyanobacterium bins.114]
MKLKEYQFELGLLQVCENQALTPIGGRHCLPNGLSLAEPKPPSRRCLGSPKDELLLRE